MEALQALNLPMPEPTRVKPFKPSKSFTPDQITSIIQRIDGIGADPETPEDMLARVAPSYRVALLNLIAEMEK